MLPNFNLSEQPTLKCGNCESVYFTPAYVIKKVSKLITGKQHDELVPVSVFRCFDCGDLLPESMPDENFVK